MNLPLVADRGILGIVVMQAAAAAAIQASIVTGPSAPRSGSRFNWRDRSKYMPHQGERECARRRRQMARRPA